MQQFRELHLAHNIESLNRIAINDKAMLNKRPTALLNVAKKLYIKSQSDPLDEEVTYILLYRFIHVFNHLVTVHNDKNFVNVMLGKEARTAQVKMNQVKSDLIKRYKEDAIKKEEDETVVPLPAIPVQEEKRLSVFNNELFISCLQLFGAFKNKNLDLLIMDARTEADFAESHIKDVKCINIPESCIRSGLSAHKLGLALPSASKEQWNRRDSFHVVVLMDWSTSRTNFPASRLEKLRSILVEWDPERTYKEKPVVLNEGYIEWLEMFPMLCTTANVKYSKVNKELDDLLNLDTIEYPTDAESKSHEVFTPQQSKDVPATPEVNISHEEILEEEKKIIEQNTVVAKELLKTEQQWKDLHTKIGEEHDVTKLEKLKLEEEQTEEIIKKLMQQEEDLIDKKSQLANQFNLAASFKPGELPENTSEKLQVINKLQEEHLDMVKAHQAFAEDRQRLLAEARQARKPRSEIQPNKKPTINRATKPKTIVLPKIVNHIEGKLEPVSNGLTTLINIRNTCYMNTIIQCLRHMPDIIHFYCNGEYTKQVHRSPPIITNEVANLVRALWSNSYSVIKPQEFYKRFTNLVPIYKQGHHEDCMEFFLQLYNYLSDDCALDISSKSYWSDTQMAWYKQHCGKISFYINMFYHQVRIQYSCSNCRTSNLKFEIENIFYLSVPDMAFRLEQSMKAYLYTKENSNCKKCNTAKTVKVTLSYHPNVLIIALKRHIQDYRDSGTVHYRKNENQCYFPIDNFRVGTCTYALHAVALHSGNTQSGHYTAACLNPTNNKWYLYNDDIVTPIDILEPSLRIKAYAFFYSMKKDYRNNNIVFEE